MAAAAVAAAVARLPLHLMVVAQGQLIAPPPKVVLLTLVAAVVVVDFPLSPAVTAVTVVPEW